MITDINELKVGKNYLVKVKTLVAGSNNEAYLVGKFNGFIERIVPIALFTEEIYIERYYELGQPNPFTIKQFDFDFIYWIPNWHSDDLSNWQPFPQNQKYYYERLNDVQFEKKDIKIYSLGQTGQLITPTTPPNQVPELAYLISGNDTKTKFSKLPKEVNDHINSFLGGKRKSRKLKKLKKSRKLKRSRKSRK